MIVVRIELWPGGHSARAREIGRAHIVNCGGSADAALGNYKAQLFKSPEYAKTPGVWRSGAVLGFRRKGPGALGPWDLLLRALAACVRDRSPGVVGKLPRDATFGPPDAPDEVP